MVISQWPLLLKQPRDQSRAGLAIDHTETGCEKKFKFLIGDCIYSVDNLFKILYTCLIATC